jgi:glycosyltransferase involved in cell wall biosynthesis
MKILMVNYEYPPLGGRRIIKKSQLAEALTPAHDIAVLTSRFAGQKNREILRGVKIFRVPVMLRHDLNAASLTSLVTFLPSSLFHGLRSLDISSFDVIHSMFAIPSAPSGMFLARHFKKPHILSLLGGDVYDPSKKLSPHNTPVLHAVVKNMMDRSDHVVAMSADIRERALRYYQPAKNIETIPLGIPEPQYKVNPREAFGLRGDDIVLVTVGRLVARKATHELITILDAIQNPRLKLVVLGDGPERQNLISLVNSLGLQDQVIFTGFVSDEEKFQYLNAGDLYVSTSQHEGFGIVFLEAMACGLPVVCYNKGGQVDFLENNVTGYLVTLGNQAAFQDKLSCLIKDESLRMAISSHNKEYVRRQYSISRSADSYLNFYEKMIKKGESE